MGLKYLFYGEYAPILVLLLARWTCCTCCSLQTKPRAWRGAGWCNHGSLGVFLKNLVRVLQQHLKLTDVLLLLCVMHVHILKLYVEGDDEADLLSQIFIQLIVDRSEDDLQATSWTMWELAELSKVKDLSVLPTENNQSLAGVVLDPSLEGSFKGDNRVNTVNSAKTILGGILEHGHLYCPGVTMAFEQNSDSLVEWSFMVVHTLKQVPQRAGKIVNELSIRVQLGRGLERPDSTNEDLLIRNQHTLARGDLHAGHLKF